MSDDFSEVTELERTALVVFKFADLVAYSDGILDAVEKVAAEARACVAGADISTPAGQAIIRSTAYKVARAKADLDELGKTLVEDQKKTAAAVDKSRREMRARLDAVKEEIRRPLTEFEEAEERRKNDHENALSMIDMLLDFSADVPSVGTLKNRLAILRGMPSRDWQEFKMRAQETTTRVDRHLCALLDSAEATEYAAELVRRKHEEDKKREQQERDERIAREAAEKAKRDAEEAAERERLRVQQERDERDARVAKAARDAIEAAKRAAQESADAAAMALANERRRVEAAEECTRRAEERAEQAAAAERQRIANEKAEEALATAKREANKRHRARTNAAARDAICAALAAELLADGKTVSIAVCIVTAIAKGEIPKVAISY
jgi:hypothetical protein